MARPIKDNAEYFSHDSGMRDDARIKALRRKFSHVGYSIWNMLLEYLCNAKHFKTEYNEDSIEIMAGDFCIEPAQLKEIINYLITIKLINLDNEIIYSQTMIDRFSGLLSKRKRDSERFKLTKTKDSDIIADDNAQSKEKNSREDESKENEKKEKGSTENLPHIFFNDTFFSKCEKVFEQFSPNYVWEMKDREELKMLLKKVFITKPDLKLESEFAETFSDFIKKLPDYWRTKKFTIPNLNKSYNEIVNEIRAIDNPSQCKRPIIVRSTAKNLGTPTTIISTAKRFM